MASRTQPAALDYYGVVWGPGKGEIRALPPLPSDTLSLAANINERGQVVGQSGPCINPKGFLNGVFLLLFTSSTPTPLTHAARSREKA
jgi:hypothetical protein